MFGQPTSRQRLRRVLSCVAVSAVALAGLVVGAGSASASDAYCRDTAANEPIGVQIKPCLVVSGTTLSGWIGGGVAPGGTEAFPCAQLWYEPFGTTSWTKVFDFGCEGRWIEPGMGYNAYCNNGSYVASPGNYIMHAGYWATLDGKYGYYGDVQSLPAPVH